MEAALYQKARHPASCRRVVSGGSMEGQSPLSCPSNYFGASIRAAASDVSTWHIAANLERLLSRQLSAGKRTCRHHHGNDVHDHSESLRLATSSDSAFPTR